MEELDRVVDQFRLALGEFVKGDPEPAKRMFSHLEDVTLATPSSKVDDFQKPA